MIAFDIRLFGAIEIQQHGVRLTGFRSQKALVLLAYLLCEQRPVTRDYLAGLGWPESDQSQALGLLRRSLHDLQRQLPGCLDVDSRTVRVSQAAPVTVDCHQFATLAAQENCAAWAQAVALYRAPFLQGVYLDDAPELENWLLREQARWQGEVVRLLDRLAAYHRERAAYQEALAYTQQGLALEPWREEAHRQAMLLLARLGQTSAALAQYETCCRLLRSELDVAPAPETERLRTRLAAIAQRPAPPLPPATTPFIGRRAEVAELTQLLASPQSRLITLVGPGGMGKTRLVLAVARNVVTDQRRIFLHGVVFVPLVGVETLPQTVAALGQALAFPFQSQGAPENQLLHYLRDKELLLVLDNFEQLVNEPILDFVRQLLNRAPDLKLLITSRVRLNLQTEQLYWVQGLPVPVTTVATAPLPVAEITTYSGVQLFLSTVQRSRPHYTLSTADGPAVMAICQLVQGMPLALELAATWMNVLTPAEIAAELTRNLDFLASDLHDLPLRQRSMRAVFETSWRLLTAEEQHVFQQLAVFRGSFTREAAQVVTKVAVPVLVGLIHKSFLQRTTDDRYQIHELLRQFGEEKLAETPTRQTETQDRHSHYYLTFVTKRAVGLQGPRHPVLLHEISQELDNIRHGWLWAAAQGNFALIDSALDGLYDYYQTRSQQTGGIEAFTQAIHLLEPQATSPTSKPLLNRLQARQGALCCELGHYTQALTLLQRNLTVARRLQDKREIAFCLEFMGRTVWWQGAGLGALSLLEESLNIRYLIGDRVGMTATLDILAAVCDMSGDFCRAKQFAEQGLIVSREIGYIYRSAHILKTLGSIAAGLGEYDTAVLHYQDALAKFRQLDEASGIVSALAEMSRVMYASGEFPSALFIQVLKEAVTLARKLGSYHSLYRALGVLGDVSIWIGDYETGRCCGQELVELSQQMPPNFLASCLRLLGEANVGLGKLALARRYLAEALAVMVKSETRLLINSQAALLAWANLLCQECTQPAVASQPWLVQQRQAQALEIVSSLLYEPKARPMHKRRAGHLAVALEALLPSAVAAVAKANGASKTLVQIVHTIVCQEPTSQGRYKNY